MTDSNNGGSNNPSSEELEALLRDSPFGVLLDIPGAESEDIIQGFARSAGGAGSPFGNGGSAPNANEGPYGGNPFANFGNPNAPGSPLTGGVNPWAAINQAGSSNPFAGGSGSGNPFTGSDNPFGASDNPFAGGDNTFAGGGGFPFA